MEMSRTLWGYWVQKFFCFPHFLFVENRLQPPWFWVPKVKIKQSLIREGRATQKQQCSLGQVLGFPSRDTCNGIFALFCRTKTPSKWKISAFSTSEKLIRRPPETRLKACRPYTHCDPHQQPLKALLKTPHQIPPGWDTQFLRYKPTLVPLPGKTIKLFFSTLPKTRSLRFNLVPVHRSLVFGITKGHKK